MTGQRFVVRADELLTAFWELEEAVRLVLVRTEDVFVGSLPVGVPPLSPLGQSIHVPPHMSVLNFARPAFVNRSYLALYNRFDFGRSAAVGLGGLQLLAHNLAGPLLPKHTAKSLISDSQNVKDFSG